MIKYCLHSSFFLFENEKEKNYKNLKSLTIFIHCLKNCNNFYIKYNSKHDIVKFVLFFICFLNLQRSPYVYFLNCGTLRNRFILRLNESRDLVERARESVYLIQR